MVDHASTETSLNGRIKYLLQYDRLANEFTFWFIHNDQDLYFIIFYHELYNNNSNNNNLAVIH